MFPELASCNSVDRVSIHSEFSRQFNLGISFSVSTIANLNHLFRRELNSARYLLALGVASLGSAIRIVGRIVTKEQMVGIDTSSVVALVQHSHSIRNAPVVDNPRNAVRSNQFGWADTVITKLAVSIPVYESRPNPTGVCFNYVSKQPISEWNPLAYGRQCVTALRRATLLLFSFGLETRATMGTLVLNHTKLILSMVLRVLESIPELSIRLKIPIPTSN